MEVHWRTVEGMGISTVVEELTSCIRQQREVWTGMIDKLTVTAEENWAS